MEIRPINVQTIKREAFVEECVADMRVQRGLVFLMDAVGARVQGLGKGELALLGMQFHALVIGGFEQPIGWRDAEQKAHGNGGGEVGPSEPAVIEKLNDSGWSFSPSEGEPACDGLQALCQPRVRVGMQEPEC